MPGSFEKKVQEKLEELKLDPSAPIWEKIELQIKPEKKRRRGLFWVPLLILALAATGWWLYNGTGEEPLAIEKQSPAKTTDLPVSGKSNGTQRQPEAAVPNSSGTNDRNTIKKVTGEKNTSHGSIEKNSKQTERTALPDLIPLQPAEPKYQPATARRNRTIDATGTITDDAMAKIVKGQNNKIPEPQQNPVVPEAVTERDKPLSSQVPDATKQQVPTPTADTVAKDETGAEKQPPALLADTGIVKQKIAATPKKWLKTITLQGGWNFPAAGLFSPANDLMVSPQQSSPGTAYANTPSGANPLSGGMSFMAGAGVVRAIGDRWELAAGLQYAYHRLHTRVGAFRQVDTGFVFASQRMQVEGYYRNGSQADYTINYHQLQIPVSVGYRPFASLPITIQAGALYGRLLQCNALTYNRFTNGYYYNRHNINTHHFALFSSVQYRIASRRGVQIGIGPVLHYQLTPLQKVSSGNSGSLLIAGLKAGISF